MLRPQACLMFLSALLSFSGYAQGRASPHQYGRPHGSPFRAEQAQVLTNGEQAQVLTNGGTYTLLGVPIVAKPLEESQALSCNVPICSRDIDCKGSQCCYEQMFEAVSQITNWMDKTNIEYFLMHGTLLGAYRNKDVIPWTSDVDIAIFARDVEKITSQEAIPFSFAFKNSYGIPRGCEQHRGIPGEVTAYRHVDTYGDASAVSYYIDLYVLDLPDHGGNSVKACIDLSRDADGSVLTSTVMIRDRYFKAPREVESCLVAEYGDNWKIPDPERKGGR